MRGSEGRQRESAVEVEQQRYISTRRQGGVVGDTAGGMGHGRMVGGGGHETDEALQRETHRRRRLHWTTATSPEVPSPSARSPQSQCLSLTTTPHDTSTSTSCRVVAGGRWKAPDCA